MQSEGVSIGFYQKFFRKSDEFSAPYSLVHEGVEKTFGKMGEDETGKSLIHEKEQKTLGNRVKMSRRNPLMGGKSLSSEKYAEDFGRYSLNNTPTNPEENPMTKTTPQLNEHNLEEAIFLDELIGYTNKSREQIILEAERQSASLPPAPRLDPNNLPESHVWVEIPEKVIDALRNIIADNELPIDRLTADWLEAEVAFHNGVPAEHIAADDLVIRSGKAWVYVPESARSDTGFSFYP